MVMVLTAPQSTRAHSTLESGQQALEKIIFAHELERRKWALEIHDGIIQSLANIYYRLQAHRKLLNRDPTAALYDLSELEELASEAMVEARGIIDDLRPSVLDDVGVVSAIRKWLKRVEQQNAISVSLNEIGTVPRLPSEVETAVYRIVQEALTNVRKHSRATEVRVEIAFLDNVLRVVVADNGKGFDVDAVDHEEDNWGLIGMRERAEIIDGVLKIESKPGRGASLFLKVPLGDYCEGES
ncbi:MAG: sensor histidine kinase [Chloroflexi bacterium]|nr:sensor histidine kinase [Chloroflexota bacterium]